MNGISVVKVGGNELDDAAWVARLAATLARCGGLFVLVHGGGKEVSELQRRLGAEPEWRDGLRVTTPATLRVVSMVLSGLVNKRLVAALLDAGVDALGISGEDGGLLQAVPMAGGALGRTGEITAVRVDLIRTLLAAGLTPVVSPVSRGADGGALNVNADDAAAAVAAALYANELLLVSDVPGVRNGADVLEDLDPQGVEDLVASGIAFAGMAPKLRAAARAAATGVEVRIGGVEMLEDAAAGTRITPTVVTPSPSGPHAPAPSPKEGEGEKSTGASMRSGANTCSSTRSGANTCSSTLSQHWKRVANPSEPGEGARGGHRTRPTASVSI